MRLSCPHWNRLSFFTQELSRICISNHKTMIQDEIGVANSLLVDSLVDANRPIDIRQACTIVAYLSRSCMSGAGGIAGDQQWAQQHNTGEQDNQ